jgi:hypothetical protein
MTFLSTEAAGRFGDAETLSQDAVVGISVETQGNIYSLFLALFGESENPSECDQASIRGRYGKDE